MPIPPPLTETEVAEAEREWGISLPAEYRAYLLEVSAGGAVMSPLTRTARGWWWEHTPDARRELIAVPFPHPDSCAAEDDERWLREPRAEDFPDARSHVAAHQAWEAECEDFEDRRTAGAIVIQEHGCGFATLLALTGPLAGTLWWDGRATCDLIVPLSLDHFHGAPPVTFGQWVGRSSWDLLPPGWG